MRSTVALLLVLATLVAMPAATGQDGAMVAEDACGDTSVAATGTPGVAVVRTLTWTDLAGLSIAETEDAFAVTVHYCPDPDGDERGAPTSLDVYFEHNGQTYWLDLYSREQDSGAALYRFDLETRDQRLVGPLEQVVDAQARTYGTTIPRSMLLDGTGAPPFPGRHLVVKYVESFTVQVYSDQAQVNDFDRMPDTGFGDMAYEVRLGAVASGSARLLSANPSRASNGAAASYVYELIAANDGAGPQAFRLDAADVPPSWSVELPVSALTLDGGEEQIVPVIVTTPFAHQHGARETAAITLSSLDDAASKATVNLNIIYHDVPQPAGHHDTLYLHARNLAATPADEALAASADVFMNTLAEDPEDKLGNAYCSTPSLTATSCGWDILLSPSLQIGLDFDLTGQGELTVPIGSTAPVLGATLGGELRLASRESVVLADLEPVMVETSGPGSVTVVKLAILPRPEGDFVPYDGAGNMILSLAIDVGRPVTYTSGETPYIAPGGWLTLPLHEYREPFTGLDGQQPALGVVGPAQRKANPGDVLVFGLEERQAVGEVELLGVNADWASVIGGKGERHVVVRVPDGAGRLDLMDLILQATTLDGGDQALARIIVLVDDVADHPDDAALAAQLEGGGGRDAPTAPVAWLLAALAAALLGRRARPRATALD